MVNGDDHGAAVDQPNAVDDPVFAAETLEVMSDHGLMRRIRRSTSELEAGEAETLTREQALALIRKKS